MLKKYKHRRSRRWYICFENRLYDQKVIVQAAHANTGRKSRLRFNAEESIACLDGLHFAVVEFCCKTARPHGNDGKGA